MHTILLTTLVLTLSPVTMINTTAGATIRGKKAAKTAKILKKAGVETEEGMGRSRLSAPITCYNDRGYWCEVGKKGIKRGKKMYRLLVKMGATPEDMECMQCRGKQVNATIECEQSLGSSSDAYCCLGEGCL